jgi:hypothetical protein
MTTYLGNAMSIGMLDMDAVRLDIRRCAPTDVPADAVSIVGHADTADLLSGMLGREIPMRRVSTSLEVCDVLYVAQYTGPRLPEGARSLPEGAQLRWYRVEVRPTWGDCVCGCGEPGIPVAAFSCARRISW